MKGLGKIAFGFVLALLLMGAVAQASPDDVRNDLRSLCIVTYGADAAGASLKSGGVLTAERACELLFLVGVPQNR